MSSGHDRLPRDATAMWRPSASPARKVPKAEPQSLLAGCGGEVLAAHLLVSTPSNTLGSMFFEQDMLGQGDLDMALKILRRVGPVAKRLGRYP